jgi:hypothetical protein
MASGADAHLSIVDNHARFESERQRAGGSGETTGQKAKRLTAYIVWPSTHARIVQQSAKLSLIESFASCTIHSWGPGELSTRFGNPSWSLESWKCDSNATCERLTVRGRRGCCPYYRSP